MDTETRIKLLKIILGISAATNLLLLAAHQTYERELRKSEANNKNLGKIGKALINVIEEKHPELILDEELQQTLVDLRFDTIVSNLKGTS